MIDMTCLLCLKEFAIFPCRLKKSKTGEFFCSKECFYAYRKAKLGDTAVLVKGKIIKTPKSIISVVCEICKKEFNIFPSTLKGKHTVYCSIACRNSAYKSPRLPPLTDEEFEIEFWAKVDKTPGLGPKGDCWEWRGPLRTSGYGSVYDRRVRKPLLAHRVVLTLVGDPIPSDLFSCHTCDNKRCVNPSHLFKGTNLDNMQDMIKKGRNVKGERSAQSYLVDEEVYFIKYLSEHIPDWALSALFKIKTDLISKLRAGKSWRHITKDSFTEDQIIAYLYTKDVVIRLTKKESEELLTLEQVSEAVKGKLCVNLWDREFKDRGGW